MTTSILFIWRLELVIVTIGVGTGNFLGSRRTFAQISANVPEKYSNRKWPQKKRLHFHSGVIFVKLTHIQRFCEGLHIFWLKFVTLGPDFSGFFPDFSGICPDFHQFKTFGGAVALPPPTPVIVTYDVWNKTPESIYQITRSQWCRPTQ